MACRLSILVVLLYVFFSYSPLFGQEKENSFYFSLGHRKLRVQDIRGNGVDFVSRIDTRSSRYKNFSTGAEFKVAPKLSLGIDLLIYEDLVPVNYKMYAKYFLKPGFGLMVGFHGYTVFVDGGDNTDLSSFPSGTRNVTPYLNSNREINNFEYGLGVFWNKKIENITLKLEGQLGVAQFGRYNSLGQYYHFQNSYERVKVDVIGKASRYLYVSTGLSVSYFPFKRIGLQGRCHIHGGKRSLDYERTTYHWTEQNLIREDVKAPKHRFFRTDSDIGLVYRF